MQITALVLVPVDAATVDLASAVEEAVRPFMSDAFDIDEGGPWYYLSTSGWLPDVLMAPWPAMTWPPTGRSGLASANPGSVANASAANIGRTAHTPVPAMPAREAARPVLFCLPVPVVSSLTATS